MHAVRKFASLTAEEKAEYQSMLGYHQADWEPELDECDLQNRKFRYLSFMDDIVKNIKNTNV